MMRTHCDHGISLQESCPCCIVNKSDFEPLTPQEINVVLVHMCDRVWRYLEDDNPRLCKRDRYLEQLRDELLYVIKLAVKFRDPPPDEAP